MKLVGLIVAGSMYPMEGFKSGLRQLGWIEGEGYRAEARAAEGRLDLLPDFASEMVGLGVDLTPCLQAIRTSLSHSRRGWPAFDYPQFAAD